MKIDRKFENWFKHDYHPDNQGPYVKDITMTAWRAAIRSIEIKLPPNCKGKAITIDELCAMLEEAGINTEAIRADAEARQGRKP